MYVETIINNKKENKMNKNYLGTEGKKISGEFTLTYVKQIPNPFNYGRTTILRFIFVAESGENIMLTSNAKIVKDFIIQQGDYYHDPVWAIGSTFSLEFIVKKHWKDITIVKNAKLIKNISKVA
tara:strand:- start:53 stop:424 length:372 start_codon:yes stop_codon:yes gene_type:complete